MALKISLLLCCAWITAGRWVIVTPDEAADPAEIKRWIEVLTHAEKTVHTNLDLPRPRGQIRVRVAPSSGDFAAWTGCSIWQGAALKEGDLIVQPLHVLENRGVTTQIVTHEYVHLVLAPYDVPLWLNEGLAVLISGQVETLGGIADLPRDVEEITSLLASGDSLQLKRGYLAAAVLVSEKINAVGADSLSRLIKEEAL